MDYLKNTLNINKKWSLASLLLLASGLLLAGICGYLFPRPYVYTPKSMETAQVAKMDNFVENYDISYPVFHIEKIDMMMRNYATHLADDFLRELGNRRNDPRSYLTVKYTILHYGTRTITVVFHQQKQLLGQTPLLSQKIMTFDLQTQKQLEFNDIFKDQTTARVLLVRILHDYFKHSDPTILSPPELEQIGRVQLKVAQEYMLSEDALIIYMNPHQPTSLQGIGTISIKKELLADVLNDAFVISDADRMQVKADPATYTIETMPRHDVVIDPNGKMLALTFDDGPGNLTSKVLDVLKKYSAHATFFVIGRQVSTYAPIVQRTVAEGHEIGNHSWSHPKLTQLSHAQLRQQIDDTQQAIKQATGGYVPVLMRPPQGVFNGAVATYLQSQGLSIQLWNVDTLDWLNRDSQVIYDRVMSGAGDGRIILLHDIHSESVNAAIRAIPDLIGRGYQLVTVSQLHQYR